MHFTAILSGRKEPAYANEQLTRSMSELGPQAEVQIGSPRARVAVQVARIGDNQAIVDEEERAAKHDAARAKRQ